ncbi:protein-L-isoaspartate O-methyltransferase [Geopyxis carbonaria]|nr:protein-L-isoaspartate O-methyltransferase [Geopyxis carbonaria]
MSWMCSGSTNAELVSNLWKNGLVKSVKVRDSLIKVDRAHFSPTNPYEDSPQHIGFDATISAPHMHAYAAEALLHRLDPGSNVLDVGSGSGYLTAVFAHIVSPGGRLVGVEHIPQLCTLSINNLQKDPAHADMLKNGTIKIINSDGRLGFEKLGPYDAIHVGAASDGIPQGLIDQLKAPGSMVIPVRNKDTQHIWKVEKDKHGDVTKTKCHGVLYVPLTDAKVFQSST